MTDRIPTSEAAQRLGVKRTTLYSYVSRGLLTRSRRPGQAESLFDRAEIDALVRERRHPGAPAGVLRMRSVSSAVSSTREGELFLRGVPLADLADSCFEDVVELVLGAPMRDVRLPLPPGLDTLPMRGRVPALSAWTAATADPATDVIGAVHAMVISAPEALGAPGRSGSIAERTLTALRPGPASAAEIALVDTALISLTDHGLAASAVATRVVASARATAYDALNAGYAALAGRLHGRIVPAAIRVLEDGTPTPEPEGHVAGFGHFRHPYGDPRAEVILARLRLLPTGAAMVDHIEDLAERLDQRPNIDAALAGLVLTLRLPEDAGEVLFQLGRTVGMGAHMLEELDEEPLRWRARDQEL